MTRLKKELHAWPESKEELLALIESFDRLQKKHSRTYDLSLSIFGVHSTRSEIDAVVNADDKLAASGNLFAKKIDFWS